MELEIVEHLDSFRNFVGLLKTMKEDDLTLYVTEEGIDVKTMDNSHVAMVMATVKPGLFDSFTAPKEERITVNMTEFMKFLDRIGKDERVKISHDGLQAKLVIQTSKGGLKRRFTIPVMEPYDEEVPVPKISFKASSRILTKAMRRAVRDAELVSEHVKVEITAEQLKTSATGDMGSAMSEWDKGSDELLDLKAEEESHATFTLSWVKDIINALNPLTEVVVIELSTDMPLKVKADAAGPHIEVELYLAPCIGV